jgi:hypothetical protein
MAVPVYKYRAASTTTPRMSMSAFGRSEPDGTGVRWIGMPTFGMAAAYSFQGTFRPKVVVNP